MKKINRFIVKISFLLSIFIIWMYFFDFDDSLDIKKLNAITKYKLDKNFIFDFGIECIDNPKVVVNNCDYKIIFKLCFITIIKAEINIFKSHEYFRIIYLKLFDNYYILNHSIISKFDNKKENLDIDIKKPIDIDSYNFVPGFDQ